MRTQNPGALLALVTTLIASRPVLAQDPGEAEAPFLPSDLSLLLPLTLHEGGWTMARPDSHAPIGVMGDHTHHAGEWMLSYRYMRMEMDGNRDGTDSVSDARVLEDFMVTPTRMTMEMHMIGAMYAPTDDLTLMAMVPFVSNEMDHLTRMGVRFTTETEGIGDVRLAGLLKLHDEGDDRLHANLGLSLPTGSIDERDDTPAGNVVLPYPMQLGSGTYDLMPGLTWLGQRGDWSFGAQLVQTFRIGENERDYRLGNRTDLTAWGAYRFSEEFSASLRLAGSRLGNIHGQDETLNPMMIPTADADLRGGRRVDAFVGVNYRSGAHRLALEYGLPAYQDLDGPQLETDSVLVLGYQVSF